MRSQVTWVDWTSLERRRALSELSRHWIMTRRFDEMFQNSLTSVPFLTLFITLINKSWWTASVQLNDFEEKKDDICHVSFLSPVHPLVIK